MKTEFREMLSRIVTAGIFLILGIGLCWRAYSFADPLDTTLTAPVMSIILGLVLSITGIVLIMRGGDFEMDETIQERHSAA
jgi:hypothetical protein